MPTLYRQSNRGIVQLSPTPVGSGGEATIFAIEGEPYLVAKIYKQPTQERQRKLSAMVANPPLDPTANLNHISIAWPQDLLLDFQGNFVGFLMPRAVEMWQLLELYNPKLRRRRCPEFRYDYLLRTAINMAGAMNALHERGYVVADVNESNILVTRTALVTMIDTDSFQVQDKSGKVYRCLVGKPDFTPPELQGKRLSDLDRGIEHDLFGLATLIFQLLMEGRHPFDAKYIGSGETPSRHERIQKGHFPYGGKSVPYAMDDSLLSFNILPSKLRDLFQICYENGYSDPTLRPTAKEWKEGLEVTQRELQVCWVNGQHRYAGHLATCPWCERTQQLGQDPFPSEQEVRQGLHLARPSSIATLVPPPVRLMEPVILNPSDGSEMILIPAGEFLMGSAGSDKLAYDNEKPQQSLYLDAYYISKNLVTVKQYIAFCDATGRKKPAPLSWGWKDDHPIVNVSWDEAKAYCKWAGGDLPTEAQWEKAARGTTGLIYPWGNTWDASKCANSVSPNSLKSTKPVGSYPQGASPYGILDMAGNVWQWCQDTYNGDYYKTAPNRNPVNSSVYNHIEILRVVRGGSWSNIHPYFFRAAYRYWYYPYYWGDLYGFRCAFRPTSP